MLFHKVNFQKVEVEVEVLVMSYSTTIFFYVACFVALFQVMFLLTHLAMPYKIMKQQKLFHAGAGQLK